MKAAISGGVISNGKKMKKWRDRKTSNGRNGGGEKRLMK
jgi:hypothetical protein